MKRIILAAALLATPVHAGNLTPGTYDPVVTLNGVVPTECRILFGLLPCDDRHHLPVDGQIQEETGAVAPTQPRPEGDGAEPGAPSPPEGGEMLGTPVTDSSFQSKADHLGDGSWDTVRERRDANGGWTQEQRDFHATGNDDWSQCDCQF